MENFTSGKYLKNYLVQILHFLNEAAVVQKGRRNSPKVTQQPTSEPTAPRSRSRRCLINDQQSLLLCELQEQDYSTENTKANSLLSL